MTEGDPQYPSGPAAYWPPPGAYPAHPPYPASGSEAPGLPTGPPARSRRALWITLGAVALVVAVGVAVLAVVLRDHDRVLDAKGTSGRTLILPSSTAGQRRVTDIDTESIKDQLGRTLADYGGSSQDVVAHAVVAVYGTLSHPRITFIGIALRDVPRLRDGVRRNGVEASLRQFMSGVVESGGSKNHTGQAFAPGPQRGFQRCAAVDDQGTAFTACTWGDESYFALTLLTGTVPLARAAATTRALRAAGEK